MMPSRTERSRSPRRSSHGIRDDIRERESIRRDIERRGRDDSGRDQEPRRDREGRHRRDSDYRDRRERERSRDRVREDRNRDKDREREPRRDKRREETHRRDSRRSGESSKSGDKRGRRERSERSDGRRNRSPSDSEESLLDLTEIGVEQISFEDFFIKTGEFRFWLKTERGKYLDELDKDTGEKYFRRFVRRWNDGALPRDCYLPHSLRASDVTSYKWSFAERRSRVNSQELAATRADVDRLTHSTRRPPPESHVPSANQSDVEVGPLNPHSRSRSPTPGPFLPHGEAGPSRLTLSDRQLARETEADMARQERSAARKAERKEVYERAEDIAPKGVGKEGKMAEKRAQNEVNREMRDKDVEGLEVDEGTLMGDDNPFQAALRAREAAAQRRADRKAEELADKRSALEERMSERREKESATMEMFKALAKQRFG